MTTPPAEAVAPTTALDGLNPEQLEAASAVRGPVAILAGAGTGKTTTITRRIAHQVLSGTFTEREILAVTFTEKAAGELRGRLGALGVRGVEARTFHSAAFWQLKVLWQQYMGVPLGQVTASKYALIAPLVQRLPMPFKFRPVREYAAEIEWAKNRMIGVDGYQAALRDQMHEPSLPADIVERVYEGYEERKERAGAFDFEDMLGRTVQLFDRHPEAIARIRERFRAITVDEYQDVNPLQQALLERWLGDSREVCVVGDDYQTIFSFTGAAPHFLLDFPKDYPDATMVRLERNYRSTPQVLALANRLAPKLGGFDKQLVATKADGPEPELLVHASEGAEVAALVERLRALHAGGTAWEETAVLYRLNARSEPFEEALAAAGIPYQVKSGAFLKRQGPRGVVMRLAERRELPGPVGAIVDGITTQLGYDPSLEKADDDEMTRQADLARLRALAREHDQQLAQEGMGEGTVGGFVAALEQRFSTVEDGRGVNLMTFHRAKGLEFDAVLLPLLCENELPYRHRGVDADVEEERRLLYVGLTRARETLMLSFVQGGKLKPSSFLAELGLTLPAAPKGAGGGGSRSKGAPVEVSPEAEALFEQLRSWRTSASKGKPAYTVLDNKTLIAVAEARPATKAALASVPGIGPAKLEKYGDEVLALVRAAD